jgi:hypothetical protein
MSKYEEKLEENAEIGAEIVNRYLTGKEKGSDKIKIASMAITQLNRHMATKGNVDAIKFAVGRSVSANAEELKRYISGNMPEYSPVKQIK